MVVYPNGAGTEARELAGGPPGGLIVSPPLMVLLPAELSPHQGSQDKCLGLEDYPSPSQPEVPAGSEKRQQFLDCQNWVQSHYHHLQSWGCGIECACYQQGCKCQGWVQLLLKGFCIFEWWYGSGSSGSTFCGYHIHINELVCNDLGSGGDCGGNNSCSLRGCFMSTALIKIHEFLIPFILGDGIMDVVLFKHSQNRWLLPSYLAIHQSNGLLVGEVLSPCEVSQMEE